MLRTRLTPEACYERLRARTVSLLAPTTLFSRPSRRPVYGSVSRQGFALTKYTLLYRNDLRTEASGRFLLAPDGGTEIPVRLGMSRVPAVFMTFWFGFIAVFIAGAIVAWLGGPVRAYGSPALLILFALAMAGLGVAFMAFARWLSRNEGPFLLRFLCELLEAEEIRTVQRG